MTNTKKKLLWKVSFGPTSLVGHTICAWTKGETRALLKQLRANGKMPSGLVLTRIG